MRKTLIVSALALALTLSACDRTPTSDTGATPAVAVSQADIAAETERLNQWFEKKYEEQLQFSPLQLTFQGRKDLYDQIDDLSEQAQLDQVAWQKASVEEMESAFDYAKLNDEAKFSYDLWKLQYENARDGVPFMADGYAFDQMNGAQSFFPTVMISFHKVEEESDYTAYVSRLKASARAFDQLLERGRKSAGQGIRPPKFAYEGVIDQSRKVITGAPFTSGKDSAIWADAQAKADELVKNGKISAERAAELKAEARKALLEQFKPAYERIIAWCQEDLPNAAVNATGVGSTHPNGKAYYEYQLRQMTTTDMSAEEIHALGLKEVERIRGEMTALKDKVGFEGDLDAFFSFIDSDPQFNFPNTDAGRQAYIDQATQAIDNIKKELPNYFGLLPKADLVVKRVEAFREQDGAAQHYFPGTPDGSRPGIYYAHLSDMSAMPKPELEVIAYHEGLPGHHMQISIAQELTGVPKFRTQAGFTAYAEGWGLYSEWLAKEMPNTYQDPYSEFGRLSSEMWRAIRLVVDTGLHAKGWTEQQAVEYFDANSAVPLAAIKSEVQRYLIMPGQATAYKIGMIRIQELRRKAEAELGEKFDIKGFHDTVLGGGALPLTLLGKRVDQWIARVKAEQG
ncbi:DUF885 domain-containing protein [Pseudoxanthomonas wuyuanensis]|uniref:Uncharacterized conserved protein, DUF885 familyt n=1 Tax=Pseudoxanthomonas wuyuanensis TaxID=1073196 RepID=A0A286CXU1_9GAMM|nr:DUF885 domain-containing protein [Pseudoxanthomonas wuyuanensis]KAF1722627.1 DUF885 domain-containing protein [Pseudoxanthomonas wuyuanensis]SOD51198.1 Uncharacterized conserved protein, DUF885 familyt [Pseudoxanthomonas wuyuanensis]